MGGLTLVTVVLLSRGRLLVGGGLPGGGAGLVAADSVLDSVHDDELLIVKGNCIFCVGN